MSESGQPAAVSNDPRPKKRVRISEEESHSKKYWFEDGNIILRVEDTLFRVHRGILSRHSAVFRDMFALPQPDSTEVQGEDVVEGCQVVDLHGDKVQDWERIFAILYDFDTAYKKQDEFPVEILASMIRLGRKYQFDAIFNESLGRIREVIPTTLEEFNGLPKVFAGPSRSRPYKLLEILLEIGNQTLLPLLYYWCAAHLDTAGVFKLSNMTFADDASVFAEKLIIGREKLWTDTVQVMLGWGLQPPGALPWTVDPANNKACRQPIQCRQAKQALVQRLLLRPHPPISLMSGSAVVKMIPAQRICPQCAQEISAAHDESRKTIWNNLPSFFGLPAWNDLKDL